MPLFLRLLLCTFAALTLAGCGGDGRRLDTVPVSGVVRVNGQAMEGAVVTFSPQGDGHAASGTTDASGKYTLTTEISGDGAVPGSYQVMVTKFEQPNAPTAPAAGESDIDAAYRAAEAAGVDIMGTPRETVPRVTAKSLVPEKYRNPQTSGLTATVSSEGANQFDFEL